MVLPHDIGNDSQSFPQDGVPDGNVTGFIQQITRKAGVIILKKFGILPLHRSSYSKLAAK